MTKVFILVRGEMHEGYSIRAVYSSIESAVKAAEAIVAEQMSYGDVVWNRVAETEWVSGCDYIEVRSYELQS